MADEIDRNQIDSGQQGRSMRKGDVPDHMRRRYYLDERGGPGLGFYVDARVETSAFRDLGARLTTRRADPNAIGDMVNVASHRGWAAVVVHGELEFRREAWLAAMALGIEARGYQPTERDRQDLARRIAQAARRDRKPVERTETTRGGAGALKVVQAVVRGRLQDRVAQERILRTARERIATWLERDGRFHPLDIASSGERQAGSRERRRSRGS